MKFFLLLLPLVLSINTNAQVKFGAKSGMNVSHFLGGSLDNANARVGLYAGGYVTIIISDGFAFQPEILYSQQGVKSDGNYSYSLEGSDLSNLMRQASAKLKIKNDYINIPLMFKYYAHYEGEGLNYEIGPQIGFLVNSKTNTKGSIDTNSLSERFDINENTKSLYKTVDLGINFGIGYEFFNGLNFGIRYNFGFTSIYDDAHNSVLSFGAGYSFK